MVVLEPGHKYAMMEYDGSIPENHQEVITFMKRVGPGYPGNHPPQHPGTNLQETLRVQIDRFQYLHNQIPHWINPVSIFLLRVVLNLLEYRAARRHKRMYRPVLKIEMIRPNPKDGHIRFEGR